MKDFALCTALAALLAITSQCLFAQKPTVEDLDSYRQQLRPLLNAIRTIESGGDSDAVGDKGKAIGAYQIWEVYWEDATAYCAAIEGSYTDCKVDVYAERIIIAYWHRYARAALRGGDYETLARIHNGGPRGASKKATIKYWEKVKRELSTKE